MTSNNFHALFIREKGDIGQILEGFLGYFVSYFGGVREKGEKKTEKMRRMKKMGREKHIADCQSISEHLQIYIDHPGEDIKQNWSFSFPFFIFIYLKRINCQ